MPSMMADSSIGNQTPRLPAAAKRPCRRERAALPVYRPTPASATESGRRPCPRCRPDFPSRPATPGAAQGFRVSPHRAARVISTDGEPFA